MQASKPKKPNAKRPLRRFVLLLGGLFVLFNVLFYGWIAESAPFTRYLALNARASIPLIRVFGTEASADGTSVRSSRFSLEIKHGCDALQPTAFFVLAMLASPISIPLSRRLIPILAGISILLLLNLVRILTLFYAGLKIPTWFEILHLDIWQAVFIFLPLVFWIGWVLREPEPRRESPMPRRNLAVRFAIRLVLIYVLLVMPWPGVGSGFSALYRGSVNSVAWVLGLRDHLHVSEPPEHHPRGDAELATVNPATGQRLRIEHGSRDWGYLPLAASLALILAVPSPWPGRTKAGVILMALTLLFIALRIAIAALYGLSSVGVVVLGEATRTWIGKLMLAFSATPVNSFVAPILLWLLVLYWTYDWNNLIASRNQESQG